MESPVSLELATSCRPVMLALSINSPCIQPGYQGATCSSPPSPGPFALLVSA